MPRKTGTMRREQFAATKRPAVAGIIRQQQREQRRSRRAYAQAFDRRAVPATETTTEA
jgi:hypothetical protein